MAPSTVARFVTGDYLAPASSRFAGQRVVAVAYLIRHPDATVLGRRPFDGPKGQLQTGPVLPLA